MDPGRDLFQAEWTRGAVSLYGFIPKVASSAWHWYSERWEFVIVQVGGELIALTVLICFLVPVCIVTYLPTD